MKSLALTTTFLALACAVTIALAQDAPAPEPSPEPKPAPKELTQEEKDALATRAYFVLRNRCWGCHGEPGKTAYGETVALDWILDYDKLVEAKLVIPGKVKDSRLIYLTTLGKMPREFDENGKPSKEGQIPEAEQKALIEWVKAGAPKWPKIEYEMEWVPLNTTPFEPMGSGAELRFLPGTDGQPLVVSQIPPAKAAAAVFREGRWRAADWTSIENPSRAVFDSANKRMVGLFAQPAMGDGEVLTAKVSGAQGWQEHAQCQELGGATDFTAAYDPDHKRVVLHGGRIVPMIRHEKTQDTILADTWLLVEGKWRKLDEPGPSGAAALIHDPVRKNLVCVAHNDRLPDAAVGPGGASTWLLEGETWSDKQPDSRLFGTHAPNSLAWHGQSELVIAAGVGRNGSSTLGWNGKQWRQVAIWPHDRHFHLFTETAGKGVIAVTLAYAGGEVSAQTLALIPWRKAK